MSRKKVADVNYGIQAEKVTAGALAVGKGARATQHVHTGIDLTQLQAALNELKAELAGSSLPPDAREMIEGDAAAIAAESTKAEPDADRIQGLLKGLVEKTKLAGQLAARAAELIEPVKKIAAALGLGATVAGLF